MKVHQKLQLRIVDSCEELSQLKSSWDKILSELPEYSPFLTWEWMNTWWGIYKTKLTRLLVLEISDGSNVVAIAPFYIRKKILPTPCRAMYLLGTGEPESKEVCSEYLDIICIPHYSKAVSSTVESFLVRNNKLWDRIELHRILDDSILMECFIRGMVDKRYTINKIMCGLRYFIILPARWEIFMKSIKPSMRRSVTVAHKKLLKNADYKIEVIENESQIQEVMQELITLHTKSWVAKGKPGAFASPEFCEFHLKIAALMHKNNNLMMLKISVTDDVVAVLYNFKMMGTSYYYQSGLNMQDYAYLKPGVLLHSEAIRDAINRDMSKYDFMMAGQNTYKSQYGCQTSEMFNLRIWNKGLKSIIMQKLALLPYLRSVK